MLLKQGTCSHMVTIDIDLLTLFQLGGTRASYIASNASRKVLLIMIVPSIAYTYVKSFITLKMRLR